MTTTVPDYYMFEDAHGGMCCGMSHIHTFPMSLDTLLPERKKLTPEEITTRNLAQNYLCRRGNDAYPEQTARERFHQIVKNITKGNTGPPYGRSARASGIIEAVLIGNQCKVWREEIEGAGFKEVNAHKNSNTGNMLTVFHLNSGA